MDSLICSRKACHAHADWALQWNNPKLHTPDRRKTWMACTDHKEVLATFLQARSFLVETIPVEQLPAK